MIICVGVLALRLNVYAVTTSYHVGNSLTYDSQPLGIEALATSRGLDHQVGFHIRSGASLQNLLATPELTSIDPNEFGTYGQALPSNAWDIVTLQPHSDNAPLTTLGLDTQSILSFIDLTRSNPANENTNFYIYQTWPQQTGSSYQSLWTNPSPNNLNTQMTRSREYYKNLIERVRGETDANVYMVPVGEVLYQLDIKMRAGQIPGFFSVGQLYRDALHLSFGPGRFVAGVTTFATILGQYPNELEIPDDFYGGPSSLTFVQKTAILETIRDVLDKHSYSGLKMPASLRADFDNNDIVNQVDLQLLLPSIDVQDPYDLDNDGDVDGRDLLSWQRNFRPQFSPEIAAEVALVDLNDDGLVNTADVQIWRNAFGSSAAGDLDQDGDTDGRDLLIWQRSIPELVGDTNNDLLINGVELAAWQQSYAYWEATDANSDGVINMADYDIWVAENGSTWTFPHAASAPPLASQTGNLSAGVVVVPEPGTAVLALLALLLPSLRVLHRANLRREKGLPKPFDGYEFVE
ncbi:MAG: hypothetical protein SH868_08000 [Bythopirellula sp.]|nr:hypothetical protein [Bythopirellula sp.]